MVIAIVVLSITTATSITMFIVTEVKYQKLRHKISKILETSRATKIGD